MHGSLTEHAGVFRRGIPFLRAFNSEGDRQRRQQRCCIGDYLVGEVVDTSRMELFRKNKRLSNAPLEAYDSVWHSLCKRLHPGRICRSLAEES